MPAFDKIDDSAVSLTLSEAIAQRVDQSLGSAAWRKSVSERIWRDVADFGVKMTDFGETPVGNLAALNKALAWSSATGGLLRMGYGVCGIDGTAKLLPYASLTGTSPYNTQIRQLAVATDDAGFYADVLVTPDADVGGGAYNRLTDLSIHGGWDSLRDYEGKVGQTNWGFDPARMTQRGLALLGPIGGPSHSALREGGVSDSHHLIERIWVRNVAGTGIHTTGRGEMMLRRIDVSRCGKYGVDKGAPDCWISDLTSFVIGDTGFACRSGNHRLDSIKAWFCGMQKTVETVGAGINFSQPGILNVVGSNITTQDTWGPGISVSGSGLALSGNVDEAGGGRLEQQGFGYSGARSVPRSSVRLSGAKECNLSFSIAGGGRTAQPPAFVHIQKAGNRNTDVHLTVPDQAPVAAPKVVEDSGSVKAMRYNRVWQNQRLIHGRVTSAQLADPAHGVNAKGGPSEVHLSPSGFAVKSEDDTWVQISGLK